MSSLSSAMLDLRRSRCPAVGQGPDFDLFLECGSLSLDELLTLDPKVTVMLHVKLLKHHWKFLRLWQQNIQTFFSNELFWFWKFFFFFCETYIYFIFVRCLSNLFLPLSVSDHELRWPVGGDGLCNRKGALSWNKPRYTHRWDWCHRCAAAGRQSPVLTFPFALWKTWSSSLQGESGEEQGGIDWFYKCVRWNSLSDKWAWNNLLLNY